MTDVVIVGSTPGALCAAIACRQAGLEVLVAEPSGQLGGIAATRGGRLWLPGRDGPTAEDYASARDYIDRVVGDFEPCSSAPRRHGCKLKLLARGFFARGRRCVARLARHHSGEQFLAQRR